MKELNGDGFHNILLQMHFYECQQVVLAQSWLPTLVQDWPRTVLVAWDIAVYCLIEIRLAVNKLLLCDVPRAVMAVGYFFYSINYVYRVVKMF